MELYQNKIETIKTIEETIEIKNKLNIESKKEIKSKIMFFLILSVAFVITAAITTGLSLVFTNMINPSNQEELIQMTKNILVISGLVPLILGIIEITIKFYSNKKNKIKLEEIKKDKTNNVSKYIEYNKQELKKLKKNIRKKLIIDSTQDPDLFKFLLNDEDGKKIIQSYLYKEEYIEKISKNINILDILKSLPINPENDQLIEKINLYLEEKTKGEMIRNKLEDLMKKKSDIKIEIL